MKAWNLYWLKALVETDYDMPRAAVVCAPDEKRAREYVACPEGKDSEEAAIWRDPDQSLCVRIGTAMHGTTSGIILLDVHEG